MYVVIFVVVVVVVVVVVYVVVVVVINAPVTIISFGGTILKRSCSRMTYNHFIFQKFLSYTFKTFENIKLNHIFCVS